MKHHLKQFWLISLVLILVLALIGCTPASLPDSDGTGMPDDLPAWAVIEATTRLSQELNVAIEEVEVAEFEQVEWPDACLGIPAEGQACAQVITPGFRVVLEVDGQLYEFRSNQDGTLILRAPAS